MSGTMIALRKAQKEVRWLRDFIQSVWDGLGEAGRKEHYELFKEYLGDD